METLDLSMKLLVSLGYPYPNTVVITHMIVNY